MQSNLISVIIPTFNREATLGASIESVQKQSLEKWEVIVVDDGSTDSTPELIKIFLQDSRIKYISQNNQGVSVARNKGAELAAGNFLIFLDSDDTLYPDLLAYLDNNNFFNFDLICWEVNKVINGNPKMWKPGKLGGIYNNITASFLAGSICYRKEIFYKAGGYDPNMLFGENYELGIRISEIPDLKIKILRKPFLKYTIKTRERKSNSLSNRLSSYIYQYNKHKRKYEDNPKENSKMNYLLGFVHEKLMRRKEAINYYNDSWNHNYLNLKPLIKIIYLKWVG